MDDDGGTGAAGPSTSGAPPPSPSSSDDDDNLLSKSEYLTRKEVLKRRSKRLKKLAKCYRVHYWALMEELRVKHREYVWKYGVSPIKDENNNHNNNNNSGVEDMDVSEYNNNNINNNSKCGIGWCTERPMPLTSYCPKHILSDSKQQLYKACQYTHRRCKGTGPILCGMPILKTAYPPMCVKHIETTKKDLCKDLKKSGFPGAASTRLASKFHVVIAEYVRMIQAKRKGVLHETVSNIHKGNTSK